ncbi:MAG: DUF2141 domain-containing protein [Ignavibacteriaceae bacterium]|nr:DUF2141 domain-containing protein [Ignavibacteriaceae bacterium]
MNSRIKQKISLVRLVAIIVSLFVFIKPGLLFSQESRESTNLGKLTVIITGFSNETGNCRFALDNSKFIYESEDTVWIGKVLPIVNKQVIVVIDSLQYGEYAVRVFHDENKNEIVDTNIFGIPTEDYGYSNNVSSWFGPPSWDRAKFIFDKPEMTIEIEVGSFI